MSIVNRDVVSLVVSLQSCAGLEAESETVIYCMGKISEKYSTEAALLVDAANASNFINRKIFLHNISFFCPAISAFVTNCFVIPARLFVIVGTEIRLNEGTTQADPVSMAIYALVITTLIMMMTELVTTKCEKKKMVAFVDDFSAAEKLKSLLQW